MINLVNLVDNSENEISLEDLKKIRVEDVWLELRDPTDEELKAVSDKLGVPEHLIRLPETSNYINLRLEPEFGVIHFVMLTEIISAREAYPVVLAFSKKHLITVATKESQQIIDLAKSRMNRTKTDAPSLVAYYIMDEIVSHHFSHLEKIETVTGNLEEEVLKKADSATIHRIFGLKSRLLSFNKILWYERGLIFNLKQAEVSYIPAKIKSLIDVTHEYLTRQIDIVETYREIMSDSIDAYLSTVSNRINSSIKSFTVIMLYLTIVTTLTSFPNTVATFFGISQFGGTDYKIIFALLIASMVLPLVWLWRKKWLKAE